MQGYYNWSQDGLVLVNICYRYDYMSTKTFGTDCCSVLKLWWGGGKQLQQFDICMAARAWRGPVSEKSLRPDSEGVSNLWWS